MQSSADSSGGAASSWTGGARPAVDDPPLVSVITVVLNAAGSIENTLRTLLDNDQRPHYEVIVIDGGSDDGTVDILRKYDRDLDYWISEPDQGIYHAMTKAIQVAKGEFLYHLNVGDRLLRMPTDQLRKAGGGGADIAAFRVSLAGYVFIPHGGRTIRHSNSIHHQGAFYRRTTFPGYDLRYRILGDFDVNQRMLLTGAKLFCYDDVVAEHASGGVSQHSGRDEVFRIIRNNCGFADFVIAYFRWRWPIVKEGHLWACLTDRARLKREIKRLIGAVFPASNRK